MLASNLRRTNRAAFQHAQNRTGADFQVRLRFTQPVELSFLYFHAASSFPRLSAFRPIAGSTNHLK